MHMTFEKIDPPIRVGDMTCTDFVLTPGGKPEHPVYRGARLIRELHVENIEKMDAGHVFFRIENGTEMNVNDEMRKSCEQQIKICDEIMARADAMDPSLYAPSLEILEKMEKIVAEVKASGGTLASILPEIGNYDHEKNS